MQAPPVEEGFSKRWGGLLPAGVGLILLAGGAFSIWVLTDPWQWLLNRSRYEEIVRRIEYLGVPAGEEREFLISKDKDPSSLRLAASPVFGDWTRYDLLVEGQVVRAQRTTEGNFLVLIKMPGRRPTYEVLYSSKSLSPAEAERSCGGLPRVHPLADHWWASEDRSD